MDAIDIFGKWLLLGVSCIAIAAAIHTGTQELQPEPEWSKPGEIVPDKKTMRDFEGTFKIDAVPGGEGGQAYLVTMNKTTIYLHCAPGYWNCSYKEWSKFAGGFARLRGSPLTAGDGRTVYVAAQLWVLLPKGKMVNGDEAQILDFDFERNERLRAQSKPDGSAIVVYLFVAFFAWFAYVLTRPTSNN